VDVPADADIMNQESFGPVGAHLPGRQLREAIALAKRSRYALGSTVYTTDLNETMRAVEELEAGMVWVNAAASRQRRGAVRRAQAVGHGPAIGPPRGWILSATLNSR